MSEYKWNAGGGDLSHAMAHPSSCDKLQENTFALIRDFRAVLRRNKQALLPRRTETPYYHYKFPSL